MTPQIPASKSRHSGSSVQIHAAKMARQEQDREDLLREATALVERAELRAGGFGEPVVIGFHRDGCGSIYVGGDPAWHFNSQLALRRAFVDGKLLKAERGRLVSLDRRRSEGEVQLVRCELGDAETKAMLARLAGDVTRLSQALAAGDYELVGQAPAEANVVPRIASWLEALPAPPQVAAAPHAR